MFIGRLKISWFTPAECSLPGEILEEKSHHRRPVHSFCPETTAWNSRAKFIGMQFAKGRSFYAAILWLRGSRTCFSFVSKSSSVNNGVTAIGFTDNTTTDAELCEIHAKQYGSWKILDGCELSCQFYCKSILVFFLPVLCQLSRQCCHCCTANSIVSSHSASLPLVQLPVLLQNTVSSLLIILTEMSLSTVVPKPDTVWQ